MGDGGRGHDDQGQVVLPSAGDRDLRSQVRSQAAGKKLIETYGCKLLKCFLYRIAIVRYKVVIRGIMLRPILWSEGTLTVNMPILKMAMKETGNEITTLEKTLKRSLFPKWTRNGHLCVKRKEMVIWEPKNWCRTTFSNRFGPLFELNLPPKKLLNSSVLKKTCLSQVFCTLYRFEFFPLFC